MSKRGGNAVNAGRKLSLVTAALLLLALVTAPIGTAQAAPSVFGAKAADPPNAGAFQPVSPSRVLDTRFGIGGPAAAVAGLDSIAVSLAGTGGVPATGVAAVVVTVTVTDAATDGFLTVYPDGSPMPDTSNVNFTGGQTVANFAAVPVGVGGGIRIYNGSPGAAEVIVDVTGYYVAGNPVVAGAFGAVPAGRVLDTRNQLGAVAGGESVTVPMAGVAGVPAEGVSAVLVTLTATGATAEGFLTAVPAPGLQPTTSNINFAAGQTVANAAVVPLGPDGRISISNGGSDEVQVIADVSGYFLAGPATTTGAFSPIGADRLVDTRTGLGADPGPVAATSSIAVPSTGVAGIPAAGVSAVLVNITATDAPAPGYLTAYPDGDSMPPTSTVNFAAARPAAGLAIVAVGADGRIRIQNGSPAAVHLIVDIAGYFLLEPPDTEPPAAVPQVQITDVTATAMTVSWTAPADADYAGVVIRRAPGATPPATATAGTAAGELDAPANSFTDTGLAPSTRYSYAVFARDTAGNTAAQGTDATGTTLPVTLNWGAATTIDDNIGGALRDVACPTTTFCVAVDNGGNAVTYDGSTWAEPAEIAGMGGITGVSCPTASFCVVVDYFGRVSSFDGTTWSTPLEVDIDAQAGGFTAVSCSSETFCAGLTSYGDATVFDGTDWTEPAAIAGYDADFPAISCTSSIFCVAVDAQGTAYVFDGSWWQPSSVSSYLSDVSCTSPTFCIAVDGNSASTYDGTSWSELVLVSPAGELGEIACLSAQFCIAVGFGGFQTSFDGTEWATPTATDPAVTGVIALSCAAADFCVAVNYSTDALVKNGDGWTANLDIDPDQGALSALSCTSPTFCVAVDRTGNALQFDGSSWTAPAEVASTADGLSSVSCVSPTFCMAVDESRRAFQFDGTTWDTWTVADPGDYLIAVSCSSDTFCVAINGSAGAHVFDGSGWSASMVVDSGPSSGLTSVSCASSTFCVAVGFAGYATRYDGTSWTGRAAVPSNEPEAVTCPSSSFCAVLGWSNQVSLFDGATWSAPQIVNPRPFTFLDAISCPSSTFCVASDSAQEVSQFNGDDWATPVPTQWTMTAISCPTTTFCVGTSDAGEAVTGCDCAHAQAQTAPPADLSTAAAGMTAEQRATLLHQRTAPWTSQRDGVWRWDSPGR